MSADTPWHQMMAEAEDRLRAAELARDFESAIAAASAAVGRFHAALDLAPVARRPLDWAETQTRLAVALRLLGALLDEVVLLQDAIRSAQAALAAAPLATAPQVWGRARAALGSVYVVLGERDGDLASLAEAAACYAEAVEGFPRARFPLEWARMLRNRGAALTLLGEVANDADALVDAVGCYRAALEAFPPSASLADRALAEWALTQSNLGQTLRLLGEQADRPGSGGGSAEPPGAVSGMMPGTMASALSGGFPGTGMSTAGTPSATRYLEDAVAACDAALGATSRAVAPEEWAMTMTNLANALAGLGDRTGDDAYLRRAIDAYRAAIEALAGPRWLRQRAIARHNLVRAQQVLAARGTPAA